MEKVTITELASQAGVSTTTVSRFLKQENVRKDVAEKINAAIKATGFVQEEDASVIMNDKNRREHMQIEEPIENKIRVVKKNVSVKKRYTFGFLCKDASVPSTSNIIKELQHIFYDYDCLFSIHVTQGNKELEERYISSLIYQQVDGIIIESCSSVANIEQAMYLIRVPHVYLNETGKDICSLAIDEQKAGEILGNYLLEKRHLIIRYLGVDEKTANAHIEGIKKIYHEKRQPGDFSCKICDGSYLNIYEKVKEIFHEKIDLLVLERDEMAIPLNKYVQEYHIAVPQNTSVISFGGHEITKVVSPTITALVYDYNQYAKHIAETMFALIEKKKMPVMPDIFHVHEGESVR